MTVMLPPIKSPLRMEPFAELTRRGLFAAQWMERPTLAEIEEVQDLSRNLAQHDTSPQELTAVLSYLVAVRGHCLLAAESQDAFRAKDHYQEALRSCRTALNLLHHATDGTPGALARWALGVHCLIQAQLAVPDMAETERLSREAMIHFAGCADEPACAGAEADASAATRLAHEPANLARQLEDLPTRALDKLDYCKYRTDLAVSNLNACLGGIHQAYKTAFGHVLGWSLANILLMATLPLNGFFRPDIPWSMPPVLGVLALWWWTWDRKYREGLPLFDWIRLIRNRSIALFREAAEHLPNPGAEFSEGVTTLLREGREARDRLTAFCLFALPDKWETLDQTATIGAEGKGILEGDWYAEMDDHHPYTLVDLLPVDPTLLPHALRIFYGTSEH